jgi:hypothetical protein
LSSPPHQPDALAAAPTDSAGAAAAPPLARPALPVTLPRWYLRLLALGVAAAGLAVLGLAAWLKPDPSGFGTHRHIYGSGPCSILMMTHYPCPTCGMTTTFALFMHGHWLKAVWNQPAGFVLALGTLVVTFGALWTMVAGRVPVPARLARATWFSPYVLFTGLLWLLVGGWAFVIVRGLATHQLPWKP